ncbi:hypothetical protein Tco_0136112 [Tanacetum coccineum]
MANDIGTGFVKDSEKGVNGDANEYGHEELESSSNGLKNSAVNKDGVANVNVTFSTDVDSVMAGHDNLHDVNVGQTPSNSTANPNKDSMLENKSWFIHNNPLILKKWNPNVNLLKEDVVNVPV